MLTRELRLRLQNALLSAFPTRASLELVVFFGLNENLSNIAADSASHRQTVLQLLKHTEATGRVDELVAAARRENPGNPELRAVAEQLGHEAGDTVTRTAVAAQLGFPAAPDSGFVNRVAELHILRAGLDAETRRRILTIRGMAGVGKTALALRFAADVRDRFPGGSFWVSAGPATDALAVVSRLLTMLGVDDRVTRSIRDTLGGRDTLTTFAASSLGLELAQHEESQGPMLLVLDDTRDDQVPYLVANALAPRSTLLITTRISGSVRHVLGPDYSELNLQGLSEADSLEFLQRKLGHLNGEAEAAAREAVRQFQGLPLALELIARQVSFPGELPELVRSLGPNSTLGSLRLGLEFGREFPIERAFADAYEGLSAEQQAHFRLLGVFSPTDFDVRAAHVVWGGTEAAARRDLVALARRSLVERRAPQWYCVHPLVRSYALGLLERANELADGRLRHATYFLERAQQSTPDEIDDIEGQLRHGWDTALTVGGTLMRSYLTTVGTFFTDRGRWRDLLEWSQAMLERVDASDFTNLLLCLENIGNAYRRLGRLDEAFSAAKQHLDVATRSGEKYAFGASLALLGAVYFERGDIAAAIEPLQRAESILRERGDTEELVMLRQLLARGFQERGEVARALEYFRLSSDGAHAINARDLESASLRGAGNLSRSTGQFAEALAWYEEELAIEREVNNRQGQAGTLLLLGDTYRALGRLDSATANAETGLRLSQEIGDTRQEAIALDTLAQIQLAMGANEQAIASLEQASALWKRLGELRGQAGSLMLLASTYARLGDYVRSKERALQAEALARDSGVPSTLGAALTTLGQAATRLADWNAAVSVLEEALGIFERLGDRGQASVVLGSLAAAELGRGAIDRGLELFRRAASTARELRDFPFEIALLKRLGRVLLDRDERDEARTTYERLRALQLEIGDSEGARETAIVLADVMTGREDAEINAAVQLAEAQRFLQAAGFTLQTTGDAAGFLCVASAPQWKKKFPTPVYARLIVGKSLDGNDVLQTRERARAVDAAVDNAFVWVDKPIDDAAWLQIAAFRAVKFNALPLSHTLSQSRATAKAPESALLGKYLERFFGQGADPYDVRTPVFDVLNFFGREAFASSLREQLLGGKVLGLFGLRKMGKSSLMRYLQAQMPCPTAWIDLEAGVELGPLCERIVRLWNRDAQIRFKIELGLDENDLEAADLEGSFVQLVHAALDRLAAAGAEPRLALFLDEVEMLMPPASASGPELDRYLRPMRLLRGLTQEDGRVLLTLAGVDPSINRASRWGRDEGQNPMFQLLQEIYLPPLVEADCVQMVRNVGVQVELKYEDVTVGFVAHASGGHPFLARLLCSVAYKQRKQQPGEISLAAIREAAERFLVEPQYVAFLNDMGLWGEISKTHLWGPEAASANQSVLDRLAGAVEPVTAAELTKDGSDATIRASLFVLDQLSVIQSRDDVVSEMQKRYEITFGLFRAWIRRYRLGIKD